MRKFFFGGILALLLLGLISLPVFADGTEEKKSDDKKSEEKKPAYSWHEIETKHYKLSVEGTKEQAKEAGDLLEAAWPEYKKFFGAEPELKDGKKLRVIIDGTKESYAKRMEKLGADASGHNAGMYMTATETAYLYNFPTKQGRHEVLLHECAHQFHYLSRMPDGGPDHDWLIEGIAELLCYHHWDGKRVEMRVIPMMTSEDHFERALTDFKSPDFSLREYLTSEIKGDYHLWYSFATWMEFGDKGKNAKRFAKLARKVEAGEDPVESFEATFGKCETEFNEFIDWLKENQHPWKNEWPEWQSLGGRSLRGNAETEAVATLKHDCQEFECTLLLPDAEKYLAGIIVNWIDDKNYVSVYINEEGLVVIQPTEDNYLEEPTKVTIGKPRKKGKRFFKVERLRNDSKIYVDKRMILRLNGAKGRFGLSVTKGSADFTDMKWKLAKKKKKK